MGNKVPKKVNKVNNGKQGKQLLGKQTLFTLKKIVTYFVTFENRKNYDYKR